MATSKQYEIEGGPSKFDLMLQRFDRERLADKLYFTVVDHATGRRLRFGLVVDTESTQPGAVPLDGESWILAGLVPREIRGMGPSETWAAGLFFKELGWPLYFRAIYDSQDRKGRIAFTDTPLIPMWIFED